jgi:RNA polymerase sigma factor (sigma-70 family)
MQEQELIPHLFRSEFSRITAVLTRSFGIEHLALAEDIASETFAAALETWPYRGVPANPVAWLYTVAKNKAKNEMQRNETFQKKIAPGIKDSLIPAEENEIDLSEKNISDSQLQMLFAISHPCISQEAQVGLALRVLCGFGIDEIADAFLTNKETINKRLFRAKEKLREEKVQIEFPPSSEIQLRLNAVFTTLYLLFNEGYYSERQDSVLREDLCLEAMRLTHLLIQNEQTNLPVANALLSLMCFHSSRFPARKNESGEIVLYHDQNESLWNQELIEKGIYFLNRASQSKEISKYHLEAGIAFWHTRKTDSPEKWENILQLYNRLLQIEYSPIAALNRTYALSKANGTLEAIREAEKLQITSNHYYYTLLGELYKEINKDKALDNFNAAYALAKSQTDKQTIKRKIEALKT